jgi:hypothetical protein
MLLAIRKEGGGERGAKEFGSKTFGIVEIREFVCVRKKWR